jgi:hypothetical protein
MHYSNIRNNNIKKKKQPCPSESFKKILFGLIGSVNFFYIELLYGVPCIHPYVWSWIDGLFNNATFFVLTMDQHNYFFMVQVGVTLA